MLWSEKAQQQVVPLYEAIISHPFLTQLANGQLSSERFNFYLVQDGLYLAHYRKIMTMIAAKCDDIAMQTQFLHYALSTIAAEQELHTHYLQKPIDAEATPSCELYTAYLYQQICTQPLPVIIASILPCFWLYFRISDDLSQSMISEDNPYQTWIVSYQSAEYHHALTSLLAITNQLAEQSSPEIQIRMLQAFEHSTKLEWLFWQSAWKLESWAI